MKFKLFLFVTFLFCLFFPSASLASEGVFTVIPMHSYDDQDSWFIYKLKPSDSIEDSIAIKNLSDSSLKLKVYPMDASLDPNQPDSFLLESYDDPQDHIGKWVTVEESSVILEPSETKVVNFKLDVPDSASLEEYVGGIAVETMKAISKRDGIAIVSRIASRVYLTVSDNPDPVKKSLNENNIKIQNQYNFTVLGARIMIGVILVIMFGLFFSYFKKRK